MIHPSRLTIVNRPAGPTNLTGGPVATTGENAYDSGILATPTAVYARGLPPSARAEDDPRLRMKVQNYSDRFQTLLNTALSLIESMKANALMILPEGNFDWERLKRQVGEVKVLLALETKDQSAEASKVGFQSLQLAPAERPVFERLSQALLQAVADDQLEQGARVVVLYSGFEADVIDSVSVINLGEHLERLTSRDLRELEMRVPLDTLRAVVDLALEIGREGREGKPVGTMFVIGDTRKVLQFSKSLGCDPFKGYSRSERNLRDRRIREDLKELVQLDGALIISPNGTVVSGRRYLAPPATRQVNVSRGLGTRHWAAAAITRVTKAVAVAVSESSGTVRIFQNGEMILRIEPFRRPMKFKEFDSDGAAGTE